MNIQLHKDVVSKNHFIVFSELEKSNHVALLIPEKTYYELHKMGIPKDR